MARYQTRGVLGGAYRGKNLDERTLLTHLVEVDADDCELRVCCRQRLAGIADVYAHTAEALEAAPTCPTCLKKWQKMHP